MSKRQWKLYLEDIAECIGKIEEYVKEMDYEDMRNDDKTFDAVMRNLEIIGEAARNVPIEIQNQYVDVPWRDMADFRNRAIHEYFGISVEIIWNIVKVELPKLRDRIKEIWEISK